MTSCAEPPTQYSHSPWGGNSTPRTETRRCAVWQRKSTGDSASRFSSSPCAAHIPQRDLIAHRVHLVGRVVGFRRTFPSSSHASPTLYSRRLKVSTCERTQIVRLPYGSIAQLLTPPPQS